VTDAPRPIRLQLSRKKGFNLQAESRVINGLDAVSVARPGKWGNPFAVGRRGPFGREPIDAEGAVGFFVDMLRDDEVRQVANYPTDFSSLKGKNLACFCPLDHACHADVLLEKAND
jgi:uncharacterized protein DUF4326